MSFTWHRDPRPEWQAECHRITPRDTRLNWLLILWEPGDPWKPVQRWEIREMVPNLDTVDPLHLQAYHGPNPRDTGEWVETAEGRTWVSYSVASRMQWELFQRYQCHSRRVWVVQGEGGGHPFSLTTAEQGYLRAHSHPQPDTPAPGSLPYAEPDGRTWRRLAEMDKLRKWRQNITWEQRQETRTSAGLWVLQDKRDDHELWGAKMLDWYNEGIKEAVDNVSRKSLEALKDMVPRADHVGDDTPRHTEDLDAGFAVSSALGHSSEE